VHVLMTTDTLGGVFNYALSLCAWLSRHEVRVTLASMGQALSTEQRCALERTGAGLRESTYRLEWMDEPWSDVRSAGDWLLELEQELRPNVIHLNGYAHAGLSWSAPVCLVAHSCVCSWFRAVRNQPAPERYSRYRRAVATGLAAARRVVAPTRAMLDMLRREYGVPERAEVIPNGVLLPRAEVVAKQSYVLAAGRVWDAAKNVGALQEAARSVPWPIRVAGEATAPEASARAEFPDLELLGLLARDELAAKMQEAAIFAAPAAYEPFGLSILEAAGHRCALVLGDIPSLRELWGECALFVSPKDSGALAQALNRLITDAPLRERLADLAQQRAQSYGLERMARAYLRLYHSLRRTRPLARPLELS
jgi:glycosyltransferase involved in cell wall biosynthesis